MVRTKLNLKYLENIEPIKKYLKDTPLDDKKIRHTLLATDKIFPYLVNRFKDNIKELKDFDILAFLSITDTNKINKITQEWDKNNINNFIFDAWKEETPETKSNILLKYVQFSLKQEEKKDDTEKKTKENSFLSYMWTFQGLLAYLGRDYEANPKKLQQLKQNGIKLGSDIEYSDVVELYDRLNNYKYKIILKIMMYSGLNPIDILQLTPNDFKLVNGSIKKKLNESIKDNDFHYIIKERTKTKRNNIYFLLVFAQKFLTEIKNYFERPITINFKKEYKTDLDDNTKNELEELKNEREGLRKQIKKIKDSNDIEKRLKEITKKFNDIVQELNNDLDDKTKDKIDKIKNEIYIVDKKKLNRYSIELETENTVRFVGKFYWDYDNKANLFGKFNPKSITNVADAFRYCIEKHNLNEHLKPLNIRSLCFTLLKDVFTFKDENIYQLWTQHKVKGLVDRSYITNQLESLINKYLFKIEDIVLIGSLKQTLENYIEQKEKAEAINENSQDIIDLKLENNKLLTMLNESKTKIDDLTTNMNKMWNFIKRGKKLEEDKKNLDGYKIP